MAKKGSQLQYLKSSRNYNLSSMNVSEEFQKLQSELDERDRLAREKVEEVSIFIPLHSDKSTVVLNLVAILDQHTGLAWRRERRTSRITVSLKEHKFRSANLHEREKD